MTEPPISEKREDQSDDGIRRFLADLRSHIERRSAEERRRVERRSTDGPIETERRRQERRARERRKRSERRRPPAAQFSWNHTCRIHEMLAAADAEVACPRCGGRLLLGPPETRARVTTREVHCTDCRRSVAIVEPDAAQDV